MFVSSALLKLAYKKSKVSLSQIFYYMTKNFTFQLKPANDYKLVHFGAFSVVIHPYYGPDTANQTNGEES